MDQKGTQLPWKGTQDSFGDAAMQMLICGIKEHGYGIHIFPALKTVSKSANLIIYAIDTVIEKWRKRHGYYLTYIFIQIDGGAENANRSFFVMLYNLLLQYISYSGGLFIVANTLFKSDFVES
jgi:hypothetical protein